MAGNLFLAIVVTAPLLFMAVVGWLGVDDAMHTGRGARG